MHGLALLLMSTIPHEGAVLRESVDMIERNAFYDGEGCLIFKQNIFYDSDGNVLAWRMDKDILWSYHPLRLIWVEQGKLRVVSAGSWKDTHTQYDVEQVEREKLPSEWRKGLRK